MDTGTIFSKTSCEFGKRLDAIAGRLQLRMGSAVREKSTPSLVCRHFLMLGKQSSSEGCPPFEYALIHKGEIVQCDPFNIENKGCPSTFRYSKKEFILQSSLSFSCQFSVAFQRYQCCGKDPIEEEEIEQIGILLPNCSR